VQPKRLGGNADHVRIEVQQHQVVAFQPGLIAHVPAGRGRPPPAAEALLAPVGRKRPYRHRVFKRHAPAQPQPLLLDAIGKPEHYREILTAEICRSVRRHPAVHPHPASTL